MDWIQREKRKRGRPRKTWMEGVQAAITTRNLETEQWRNREEWLLVSGRRQQLLKKEIDNQQVATILIYLLLIGFTCFGRCFRPSSGAYRCNYSCCYCPRMLLPAGVAYRVERQFHPVQ